MNKEPEFLDNAPISAELLADYVEGLVDEATRVRIEQVLKHDEALRMQAEGMAHLLKAQGSRQAMEQALDQGLERFKKAQQDGVPGDSAPSQNATPVRPLYKEPVMRWAAVVAALVISTLLLVLSLNKGPAANEMVGQALAQAYPPPAVTRQGEQQEQNVQEQAVWQQAVQAYQQGQYNSAAQWFAQVAGSSTNAARAYEAGAYHALSALFAAPASPAPKALQLLANAAQQPGALQPVCQWYYACALWQAGQQAQAIEQWQQIQAQGGPYASQATQMLQAT